MSFAKKVTTITALLCWAVFAISFSKDRSRYRNCYFLFVALILSVWAATFYARDDQMAVLYLIGLLPMLLP